MASDKFHGRSGQSADDLGLCAAQIQIDHAAARIVKHEKRTRRTRRAICDGCFDCEGEFDQRPGERPVMAFKGAGGL